MPECKWNREKESQGKGSEYNLDDFIMFVTHKFQHYQVYFAKKIPNFEQNSVKFPIQVPRAMFPKE